MGLFRQLFALPPLEKRYAPAWFLRSLVGRNAVREQSDDTYLYYSVFRTSFYVSFFLAMLNVASRTTGVTFDLYFFVIDLTGGDYVETFLLTYTKYTSTILLFLILPYYIVLFRLHINPRTFDLSWWSRTRPRVETMKKWQAWALYIALFLIMPVVMNRSFEFFMIFLEDYHLENSYPYFLLCAVLLPFSLALLNYGFLSIIMNFWRYSGKHTG